MESTVEVARGALNASFNVCHSWEATPARGETPIPPSRSEPADVIRRPDKVYEFPFLPDYSLTLRLQRVEERLRDLRKLKWEVAFREATMVDALSEEECRARIYAFQEEQVGLLEEWKVGTLNRLREKQDGQEHQYSKEMQQLTSDRTQCQEAVELLDRRLKEVEFQR